MNLWAKSLRQLALIAVASFFFSCEDEIGRQGYPNPNKKFNVFSVEIPLTSSVVLSDSVVTDNADLAGVVLAGTYQDSELGKVSTQPYFQIFPVSTGLIDATAVYDTAVAYFRLDPYAYGFTGTNEFRFSVHELADTLTFANSNRYYYKSSVPYASEIIGEAKASVNYDALVTLQDTIQLMAPLKRSYGERLFNIAKTDPNQQLTDYRNFKYAVKGLTLVPATTGVGVLRINILSALSGVTIYYKVTAADGTISNASRTFYFNDNNYFNPGFTNIQTDRSGTSLAGLQPYQSVQPANGRRFVQNGSPVVTKLDLNNFYEMFADTVESIIINEAQLIINNVESPSGFNPHSGLMLRVTNENNTFTNSRATGSDASLAGYHLIRNLYYDAALDRPSEAKSVITLDYNADNKMYSGFMTFFAQSLFRNSKDINGQINDNRLRYVSLYPYQPVMARTVNRTVFNESDVKLKIFYTRPTKTKP